MLGISMILCVFCIPTMCIPKSCISIQFMIGNNGKHINNVVVISMMLNMLWLTVSLPFIAESRIVNNFECKSTACDNLLDTQGEDTGYPQTGASEEKGSESSSSYNEEYLHHYDNGLTLTLSFYKKTMHDLAQDAYCAYHGELLVPPPNMI
jgi:hypothetical protein